MAKKHPDQDQLRLPDGYTLEHRPGLGHLYVLRPDGEVLRTAEGVPINVALTPGAPATRKLERVRIRRAVEALHARADTEPDKGRDTVEAVEPQKESKRERLDKPMPSQPKAKMGAPLQFLERPVDRGVDKGRDIVAATPRRKKDGRPLLLTRSERFRALPVSEQRLYVGVFEAQEWLEKRLRLLRYT